MKYIGLSDARWAVVTVLCGLLAACSIVGPMPGPSEASTTVPSLVASVMTSDGTIGVARENGQLLLMLADEQRVLHEVTRSPDQVGETSVYLLAYGGTSARALNSFVFGNAPDGATRIEVLGATATAVNSGLFVVGLSAKDLRPDQLRWRFLGADGSVIREGTGITSR
jgi:hypothetical protein